MTSSCVNVGYEKAKKVFKRLIKISTCQKMIGWFEMPSRPFAIFRLSLVVGSG